MRWFWNKGNGRIIRILSRFTQRLMPENEKPVRALYVILPNCVIPLTIFASYYFTPIDYSLNKLKKKYGYESEDEQHSVDADTRTLLQEVLDDLKETKIFMLYFPSIELEVYPCKGHEIVINHLVQTTGLLPIRRVLAVGIPDYITSSSSVTASQPYPRPIDVESTRASSAGLRASKMDAALVKSANVHSQNSSHKLLSKEGCSTCFLEEKAGNKYSEILDFEHNLSTDEKKFLFFRHIYTWTIHYQTTRIMHHTYVFSLFILLARGIRLFYIFTLLNIVGVYILSTKYQFFPEKKIMGRTKCGWSFKVLSERTLRNVGNYMAGGKTYCMKKLKHNYYVYECQQERAMHSQMERLKLMLCCLFHCFDPNLETVYNRAGGIRKWPFNYFNYDFFWAYSIKSELDKGQPMSPKWREWVSSYCIVSPDTVESQLKALPSNKLNQVPLIFQSVLIPLNKDKVWDFAAPKSDKNIGRQAQHYLKSFGLYRHSTCLSSLESLSTDIFNRQ